MVNIITNGIIFISRHLYLICLFFFYGLGQHCRLLLSQGIYGSLFHHFQGQLNNLLNFIVETGSRKSYYGNGIYVLKLSGNEAISRNRERNISYTSYKGGIRAVGVSIEGSHPRLTLKIIQGTELIFYI
jgi:hypothetical protein